MWAALLQFQSSQIAPDFNRNLKLRSSMRNQAAGKLAMLFPRRRAARAFHLRMRQFRQS
jgi:hypothetical protein